MKPNTIIESDPYNRPLPHTFCAPKHNSVVIWLCKKTAFLNIRKKLKVSEVEIFDADLLKLRSLLGKLCNPIDLKDLIADYKIDKRAVIHRASMTLESSVRNTLKKLAEEYGTHFK